MCVCVCVCVCVCEEEKREREKERMGEMGTTYMSSKSFVTTLTSVIPLLNTQRFMDAGGWPMLNLWLAEAKKTQNTALLVELLQVHKLPTHIPTIISAYVAVCIDEAEALVLHDQYRATSALASYPDP